MSMTSWENFRSVWVGRLRSRWNPSVDHVTCELVTSPQELMTPSILAVVFRHVIAILQCRTSSNIKFQIHWANVSNNAFEFYMQELSLKFYTWLCLRSVPVNLPAPFEDILIPLLLQHSLILLVLTLTIVVLVVALLLRPL